jgi:hypothetical protein
MAEISEPITRREQYLNAAATGETSGLPKPVTREEEYLAAAAKGGWSMNITEDETLIGTVNNVNVYAKSYKLNNTYFTQGNTIIDSTFKNNLIFACGNYYYVKGGDSRLIIDGSKILKVSVSNGLYYETSTSIGDSSDTINALFIIFYMKEREA